ncbi:MULTISPECIES: PEP-CTERM sorting domain-containing protein [unclassified Microcoleus]|uniref:PEP-CTERM sorting domain-containing protein n=1 Tax=unclassified Microcoleus TaxID=2642155 RepID=UPI0025D35C2C|nr:MULTISPECIES: PEP-CTERM sorting domain-containing protein [unclassified Microcoleus]
MNSITKNSFRWTYSVAVFLAFIGLQQPKATAATLSNGWNYAIDSFNDGVTGNQIGGGEFEFYGIAVKETSDRAFIAINSNLSLAGYADTEAQRGNINYGDLFFNFSGQNFNTANANGSLFAVRFAAGNDSGVATTGVYSNVTAKSVTQINSGFTNLTQYNDRVRSAGGTPSTGDLAANDPYFQQTGNWTVLNSIDSGTKVGEISALTSATLSAMGLDFSQFNAVGSQTIGFSFNKSAMPSGSYIANLFAECANDAIAIKGNFETPSAEAVPEPGTVLGTLAGFGILGMGAAKRKIKGKISCN